MQYGLLNTACLLYSLLRGIVDISLDPNIFIIFILTEGDLSDYAR